MTVIFGNGQAVSYLKALETEEYWGGSNRRTLTFTCDAAAVGMDGLNAILSDEANTAQLQLVNEEAGIANLYEGYTLKLRVGIDREVTAEEGPDAPAQYAERLVFKLGRRTFIEEQLARLGIAAAVQ